MVSGHLILIAAVVTGALPIGKSVAFSYRDRQCQHRPVVENPGYGIAGSVQSSSVQIIGNEESLQKIQVISASGVQRISAVLAVNGRNDERCRIVGTDGEVLPVVFAVGSRYSDFFRLLYGILRDFDIEGCVPGRGEIDFVGVIDRQTDPVSSVSGCHTDPGVADSEKFTVFKFGDNFARAVSDLARHVHAFRLFHEHAPIAGRLGIVGLRKVLIIRVIRSQPGQNHLVIMRSHESLGISDQRSQMRKLLSGQFHDVFRILFTIGKKDVAQCSCHCQTVFLARQGALCLFVKSADIFKARFHGFAVELPCEIVAQLHKYLIDERAGL